MEFLKLLLKIVSDPFHCNTHTFRANPPDLAKNHVVVSVNRSGGIMAAARYEKTAGPRAQPVI